MNFQLQIVELVVLVQQIQNNMKKIETFEDMLQFIKELEELAKECEKEAEKSKPCKNPEYKAPDITVQDLPKCEDGVAEPSEADVTPENVVYLSTDVYALSDDEFVLNEKVGKYTTVNECQLTFSSKVEEDSRFLRVPGITEKQLLTVLLYRNRNNSEKSDLLKQLLALEK